MSDREREISEQVARITAENARLLERLVETEKRFHRISRGVLRLQEEERARISRELHDGIGQGLTALKIQLQLLEQEAGEKTPDLVSRIAAARELAESSLAEVREMARLLRPQMLDDLGLAPTLRWLMRTLEERTGVAIALEYRGNEERVEPEVETLVFRLVQEALTNVVKHAGVSAARVVVQLQPRSILLTVEDRGRGFDAAAVLAGSVEDRGFGVRAMRDRVQFLRGRFRLDSSPDGTVLEAEIPLERGGPTP